VRDFFLLLFKVLEVLLLKYQFSNLYYSSGGFLRCHAKHCTAPFFFMETYRFFILRVNSITLSQQSVKRKLNVLPYRHPQVNASECRNGALVKQRCGEALESHSLHWFVNILQQCRVSFLVISNS